METYIGVNMIKFQDVVNARSSCPDCGGEGKDATDDRPDAETWDCPTCHGTTNKILTFMIPMDVPDGYEFLLKTEGNIIGKKLSFGNYAVFSKQDQTFKSDKPVECRIIKYINSVGETIPVMCDVCGGDGVRWYHQSIKRDPHASFNDRHFKKPCPVCNGSPETTLTVLDIQVINNKSYITEKADKDNPYGKRVLKNKWYFKVKVLEGL